MMFGPTDAAMAPALQRGLAFGVQPDNRDPTVIDVAVVVVLHILLTTPHHLQWANIATALGDAHGLEAM